MIQEAESEVIFHSWEDENQPIVLPGALSKMSAEQQTSVWPTGLVPGMRFDSIQAIRRHFEAKVREAGLFSTLISKQYNQGPAFKLGCTLCPASLVFRPVGSGYELHKFNCEHNHSLTSIKQRHIEQLEQEVFKFIRQSPETPIRKSAMQIFSLSETQYERFRRNFYTKQVYDFTFVEAFLKENRYSFKLDWSEIRGAYPKRIVAVSESMKRNYRQYRDLLRFDIVDAVIKNRIDTGKRYRCAIFSVIDCSNRIVLAAIAMYSEESEESYSRLFEMFVEKQDGLLPDIILSDCSTPILKAVGSLRDKPQFLGKQFTHIYDPQLIVKKIRQSFAASKKSVSSTALDRMAKLVSIMAQLKSQQEYDKCMKELSGLELPEGVIRDLVGCASKIFYLQMPHKFIGLSRFNVVTNSKEIESGLQGETTILQLFRRATELDKQQVQLCSKPTIFMEPIERIMNDMRLVAVRTVVDRHPFQYFMECYVQALRLTAQRLFNHATGVMDYQVTNHMMNSSMATNVSNWKCSCAEHLKTGIPCSHLLACALITPDKQYLQLFHKRWRAAKNNTSCNRTTEHDDD